jgi:hypothetical protein
MKRQVRIKDWMDVLPATVKAEILAGVLHRISSHMPEIWNRLPKWYQKEIRASLRDCAILHSDLSKEDIELMQRWFYEEAKR